MAIDEILMRDSCGKSSSKMKKYVYYNQYSRKNFGFTSGYNELTLLDLLGGTKTIMDYIPKLVPFIIIILFSIVTIGAWVAICACICRPRCCIKKDNINNSKTRFICFMVFLSLSICIILLCVISVTYVIYGKNDFNGTICSLLIFQYDIIKGQGFLGKNNFYKPYWYGSEKLGEYIDDVNNMLSNISSNCGNFIRSDTNSINKMKIAENNLRDNLNDLYNIKKDEKEPEFKIIVPIVEIKNYFEEKNQIKNKL